MDKMKKEIVYGKAYGRYNYLQSPGFSGQFVVLPFYFKYLYEVNDGDFCYA